MAEIRQGTRFLVLGANGKVGRLVRAVWADSNDDRVKFVPVVRRDCGLPGQVIWSPGESLSTLPAADAVLALWGVTPGPGVRLEMNSVLALNAMEVARATGADRVLHCSSAAVYAPATEPLSEEMPPNPISAYGRAKLDMEHVLAADQARHPQGPRIICLRIGNVAGAESLFGAMMRSDDVCLDRFPNESGPERSYIAPSELAHVLALLASRPVQDMPEVLNIAAPVATSMESIARAAQRRVIWRDAAPGAVQQVVLDTKRLNTVCPLRPETARPDHLVSDWLRWKEAG
ncbi:NAD-dependent epimerase/dehydratase family protein [Puniceibacterium sediminis]|uniref:NAD dependent epimerase/dehydratase family protein n=1 Tax=Puniceibacterium sediminis TaxID=1608407 RepID=A0A238VRS7_9RHOB|nr:NAD-dependent epimerase/dehydratase family protein [Puniceibacterium sediminis]SNR37040.1 NAD dependent epimerase/dehydratase family protein [Puniceibacterium sediminis]